MDRQRPERAGLGLGVLEDRAAAGLDQQQLARSESSAPDRVLRGEGDRPGLGRNGDKTITRDRERRRSKAVAIDHRADPNAVREDDRGGAVPWGEESGGPTPQRRDVRMRRASQGQRLGDRGQEGGGQVPAGGHQEFEPLVERERVGAARREKRPGRQKLGRDRLRAAIARAAADLLAIAADGVDLAVVGDEPERLGEAPHGMRVGRVALVEDGVRDGQRLPQVREQLRQPGARDEALVDQRPARRRWHRHVRQCGRALADRRLEAAASDDQPPLEGIVGGRVSSVIDRTGDDRLREPGARRSRRRAERGRVERHDPPACDGQAARLEDLLDQPPAASLGRAATWQEDRDDRGLRCREIAGEECQEGAVQREGDARAIARFAIGPERTAVSERREAGEGQRQHPVPGPPARVRDEPDTARIVLVPRVVERRVGVARVAAPGSVSTGRGHGLVSGEG